MPLKGERILDIVEQIATGGLYRAPGRGGKGKERVDSRFFVGLSAKIALIWQNVNLRCLQKRAISDKMEATTK